tara:strand:- start:335 stop:724 length:390 start_codon:yes stop_codon:yes gene_type:complete
MVIINQQREWTVKTMEDENNYMRDYQPSVDTILRRAQEQTLLDLARQKEAMRKNIGDLQKSLAAQLDISTTMLIEKGAMLKHIDDLENALTNIFTLWFELADASDITGAMRHHLNNFAYLYTEPTDEEE